MSQSTIEPSEFADQMKALADEAEKQVDDPNPRKAPVGFLQMLRPLVLGLEALSRATVENTMVLARIEAANTNREIPARLVSEIQEKFENKNEINQQLFNALHQELKGYKDGFILEVLQKPLVRDLITLYDDLAEIHRQMDVFLAPAEPAAKNDGAPVTTPNHVKNTRTNLHHVMQFLLEIMARIDVNILEPTIGKLNKITQRAISVEPADTEAEDGDIARSLKPGFMWREKIVRVEEVVVKKWKEGCLVALDGEAKEGNDAQAAAGDAI